MFSLVVTGTAPRSGQPDFTTAQSEFVVSALSLGPVAELFVGDARGVDTVAASWAASLDIPVHRFVADWRTHGRSAGPRRNAAMLASAQQVATHPVVVLAFFFCDPASSRGTRSCATLAAQRGLTVHHFVAPESLWITPPR